MKILCSCSHALDISKRGWNIALLHTLEGVLHTGVRCGTYKMLFAEPGTGRLIVTWSDGIKTEVELKPVGVK